MRQTQLNNNTIVTVPDEQAYLYDSNFVRVTSTNSTPVTAKVVLTDLASGKRRTLKYAGEMPSLTMSLDDSLLSLWHDAESFNLVVTTTCGGSTASHGYNIDLRCGRTLPNRAHGSEKTVYVYSASDLQKMNLYFTATGTLNVNGSTVSITKPGYVSLNLTPYIQQPGTYTMCFTNGSKDDDPSLMIVNVSDITPFSGVAQLAWTDTSGSIPSGKEEGGGAWKEDEFPTGSYCITVQYDEPCDDFNFFKVRYYNTDGSVRYLGGKIQKETFESKGDNFYQLDMEVYKRLSRKYLNDGSDSVKVAYEDLRRDSYFFDILYSPKIEFLAYDGQWRECSLKSDKITVTSDEYMDAELEFELYHC